MKWQRQRRAFSMITAIFVIVLMATVAVFIMSLSGKMVKETTAQYQHEQAVLLANSYLEYAIMAVTANDHNSSNCLNTLSGIPTFNSSSTDYNATVEISYIAVGSELSGGNCARVLSNTVQTKNTPLNIVVDVFIKYPDYDHPDGLKMTYHKRKLAKI